MESAARNKISTRTRVSAKPTSQIARQPEVALGDQPRCEGGVLRPVDKAALYELLKKEEDLPNHEVVEIALGVFSEKSLLQMTVCQVTSDKNTGPESLNDPRMGVVTEGTLCETCNKDYKSCPGHMGYIQFKKSIYHPSFGTTLAKVLSCICLTCGNLYLSKKEMEEKGLLKKPFSARLDALIKESENATCKGSERGKKCGSYVSVIWDEDNAQLMYLTKSKFGDTPLMKDELKKLEEEEERMAEQEKRRKEEGGLTSTPCHIPCPPKKKKPTAKSKNYMQIPISIVKDKIVNAISDETASLLGYKFNIHPRDYILDVYPVVPPKIRQPKFVNDTLYEDKWTEQYRKIIKANAAIDSCKETPEKMNDAVKCLYNEVATLISGDSQSDFASVQKVIQGKEGLIRSNIQGRRVDLAGRTVAGPGPWLRSYQIGIPKIFAPYLLQKERVFQFNMDKIQQFFKQGLIVNIIPGKGKYKGTIFNARKWKDLGYIIQIGDEIERHLMNGDYLISNRQPTLHRQSLMGYQVILHDDYTFRLPLSVVKALNADFDGDEINVFGLQSLESLAEMLNVMNVANCQLNAENNRPLIAPYFDALTGVYLLTKDDVYFLDDRDRQMYQDKYQEYTDAIEGIIQSHEKTLDNGKTMSLKDYIEFFLQDQDTSDLKELTSIELKNWIQKHQEVENLDGLIEELEEQEQEIEPFKEKMDQLYTRLNSVLTLSDFNDILLNMVTDVDLEDLRQRANKYGVPFYTGKILFSAALPRDLTFENSEILIKEGILVSGRVSSASVGTSHNSLVQILYKNYGPKTALNFTDDITFITNIFLSRYGFTVGLEDCMVPETKVQEAQKMLLESITESQSAAYRLSKQSRNQLENERRESQINEHLNTTRNVGTKIANYLSSENNLRVMLDSGAKGGVQNLAQMVSSAGQQYVNGKRHALMLSKGTRCLPTFEPGSEDIRARGQCYNSLMTGFTPSELYFHQAQGRVGLIDTALKTAEVGELHRNLVKMLEDIYVANDGSVRTGRNMTQNVIIQFVYGEDGFDAMNLQFTKNAFGNTPSFIDLEAEVKSLNTKYGF